MAEGSFALGRRWRTSVTAGFPCKLDRQMPSGSMTQQPWGHFRFECRVGRSSVFVFRSFVRFKRVLTPFTPDWSIAAGVKSCGDSGFDQRALGASCWFPGDSEPSTRARAIANMLRKINNTEAICIRVIVSESISDAMARADTGAR
jgi:hypothetical protein